MSPLSKSNTYTRCDTHSLHISGSLKKDDRGVTLKPPSVASESDVRFFAECHLKRQFAGLPQRKDYFNHSLLSDKVMYGASHFHTFYAMLQPSASMEFIPFFFRLKIISMF